MGGVGPSIMVAEEVAVFPMPPMGVNKVGLVVVHDGYSDTGGTARTTGLGPATSILLTLSAVARGGRLGRSVTATAAAGNFGPFAVRVKVPIRSDA